MTEREESAKLYSNQDVRKVICVRPGSMKARSNIVMDSSSFYFLRRTTKLELLHESRTNALFCHLYSFLWDNFQSHAVFI